MNLIGFVPPQRQTDRLRPKAAEVSFVRPNVEPHSGHGTIDAGSRARVVHPKGALQEDHKLLAIYRPELLSDAEPCIAGEVANKGATI
jgi:hypothetical protein